MYNMQNVQSVQNWTPVVFLYSSSTETKAYACFFIPSSVLVSIVNNRSNLWNQILSVPCSVQQNINMQNVMNMHNVKEYAEYAEYA
jgi:hypothetical protein